MGTMKEQLEKEINNQKNKLERIKKAYINGVFELKEYNEKIGVFKNNALVYTIDTYVFTLPEADKQLLKNGIKVNSIEELENLIEEYY